MEFKKLSDAVNLGLVRSTQKLNDTPEDRQYLQNAERQVLLTPDRKTMFVKYDDNRIALFVDNVAHERNSSEGPKVRQLSKNKKFKSIRHLAESLFSINPDLEFVKFKFEMKQQYPKSKAASADKCYSNYLWYRHHLVNHGRFRCIPTPEWVKKRVKAS